MTRNYISMWCSVVCSTAWAASGHDAGAAVWFFAAIVYGILSIKES